MDGINNYGRGFVGDNIPKTGKTNKSDVVTNGGAKDENQNITEGVTVLKTIVWTYGDNGWEGHENGDGAGPGRHKFINSDGSYEIIDYNIHQYIEYDINGNIVFHDDNASDGDLDAHYNKHWF